MPEISRSQAALNQVENPRPGRTGQDFPWWLVVTLLIGVWLAYRIASDQLYSEVFAIISKGVSITAFVTFAGFSIASLIGLLAALAVLSGSLILRQCARFYIEVIRGIPMLVLLFYIAFVGAPALVALYNSVADLVGFDRMRIRDLSLMWRAIIALTIGYSAFIAEVFRAGITSVDSGQIEAAMSLGLNRWQRFRFIIWPQALRTILPPLGNDFIAMIKDSSLVSVLGVADITQLGKIYAAGSFRFFETYNIVAYVYLLMTLGLSLALRRLESSLSRSRTL